jgi:hypothetical protein
MRCDREQTNLAGTGSMVSILIPNFTVVKLSNHPKQGV